MTKRLKAPAIATEEEFRAQVSEIAHLQNQVTAIAARRDGVVQRVQARYAEKIAPIDAAIDARLALVEKYAEAHRAELLPKDRKSADTVLAIFGWRTGNRTVKFTSKKVTEESAILALELAGLGIYVRTVKEIAKDKILADCKDDKTLPFTLGEKTVTLEMLGLKIAQSETFYVEPKAETGETLKPVAA